MADIEHRLEQDRASRDAAKRLLEADIEILRGEGPEPGIKQRAADGARETSRTLAGQATDVVNAHPIATSGIIGLILLLFFRSSVLDLIIHLLGDDDEDEEASHAEHDEAEAQRAERTDDAGRSNSIRRQ